MSRWRGEGRELKQNALVFSVTPCHMLVVRHLACPCSRLEFQRQREECDQQFHLEEQAI